MIQPHTSILYNTGFPLILEIWNYTWIWKLLQGYWNYTWILPKLKNILEIYWKNTIDENLFAKNQNMEIATVNDVIFTSTKSHWVDHIDSYDIKNDIKKWLQTFECFVTIIKDKTKYLFLYWISCKFRKKLSLNFEKCPWNILKMYLNFVLRN